MRVALSGGGTGGHVYPALAIDAALRADSAARGEAYASIFYGTKGGLEEAILAGSPLRLQTVPSRPLRRRLSPELALTLGANALGIARASAALRAFAPDVVIATGGYVCFPVVLAARARRITLALLEENAYPGLTNKLLAPLVDEVWGPTWTQASAFKRFVATGIPVRAEFKSPPPRPRARERLGIEPHATVIVVMGGSQGARSLNDAVTELVTRRELPREWWILHLCGARDYETVKAAQRERKAHNRITLVPYLDDPSPAYAAADLVVARAGASTLAELAVAGRASLLVPYPYASGDHQTANARVFREAGAAKLPFDAELGGDVLWWALDETLRAGATQAMEK
ncbi:MAG: UDP-N-acetylglucosamine--N-acetylmuramyl-(pentapeptide) pyrophosphoryl-undecaprenol N-acetylglucosamine transferase, partial [Candidatus Eremiobacteraeota bacterium]|nr:UDP-N-acetylglucosamine--N-acetylmuramyl-(pentapeptide) pyrophosphoryl-undecaprenol N-acetylglucosamine transferase [Candidatus Eremiobacteraeota bacterium]